jgi:hypothetical protein
LRCVAGLQAADGREEKTGRDLSLEGER